MRRVGFCNQGLQLSLIHIYEEAGGDANGVSWLLATHRDLIDAQIVINPDGGEAFR